MKSAERGADVARLIIDSGAVKVDVSGRFRWSSGLAAPLYCDHRELFANVSVRRTIVGSLAAVVNAMSPVEAIAGVPLAAIPWAAWVADEMDVSLLLVRHGAKGHGMRRQVEGVAAGVSSVVLIEDAISTGRSVIQASQVLREVGIFVAGIATILDYQISAGALARADLPFDSLYSYCDLRVEMERDGFSRESLAAVDEWYSQFDRFRDDGR